MSAYPSCKHGFNDPNGVCPQCAVEDELNDLRAQLAEANKKVEYAESLGLQFGMLKSSDKPKPYLAHVWSEDSAYARMFHEWTKTIGLDEKLAKVTAERDALKEKLLATDDDSVVGSCNCMTKTNDPAHHRKGCKYRLICERDAILALLTKNIRFNEKENRYEWVIRGEVGNMHQSVKSAIDAALKEHDGRSKEN